MVFLKEFPKSLFLKKSADDKKKKHEKFPRGQRVQALEHHLPNGQAYGWGHSIFSNMHSNLAFIKGLGLRKIFSYIKYFSFQ